MNRFDDINKEVEIYQQNYERLKNETKRRNNNVYQILSSNAFSFKYNQNLSNFNKSFNTNRNVVFVDKKDLINEKERDLKIELNNYNFKNEDY